MNVSMSVQGRIGEVETARLEYDKARQKLGEAHKHALKVAAKSDAKLGGGNEGDIQIRQAEAALAGTLMQGTCTLRLGLCLHALKINRRRSLRHHCQGRGSACAKGLGLKFLCVSWELQLLIASCLATVCFPSLPHIKHHNRISTCCCSMLPFMSPSKYMCQRLDTFATVRSDARGVRAHRGSGARGAGGAGHGRPKRAGLRDPRADAVQPGAPGHRNAPPAGDREDGVPLERVVVMALHRALRLTIACEIQSPRQPGDVVVV